MALPVIAVPWMLGGVSSALGLFGVKKGYDATRTRSRADNIKKSTEERFSQAKESLEENRESTLDILAKLGKARLEVDATSMPRFVNILEKVHSVDYTPITLDTDGIETNEPQVEAIRDSVFKASSLLQDGAAALSTGVLAGIGASGLASTIGVAGTGTAISSLSGVAATNATLAWLGGGTLASGGFGMAGGTAVLGGAVAGPLLAVMGYFLDQKAQKNLKATNEYVNDIELAIEQISNGNVVLDAIQKRTHEIGYVTAKLNQRFISSLDIIETMVADKSQEFQSRQQQWNDASVFSKFWRWLKQEKFMDPLDFRHFKPNEQQRYIMLTLIGTALYELIKVSVLSDEGLLGDESLHVLEQSTLLLDEKE